MADKKVNEDALWLLVVPWALVLVLIPAMLLRGWVLAKLWAWFVVPATGVEPIGGLLACGLCLAFSMLKQPGHYIKGETDTSRVFGQIFAAPLFTLGLGWLVHLCM